MSVNGVTGIQSSQAANYSSKVNTENKVEATGASSSSPIDDTAAVYESSSAEASSSTYSKGSNTELINKLKSDSEAHIQQLQDIVNKLISKQGTTALNAQGLKSFYESLEVDPETKAQAQKDIAEDGYWGVEQTSSRIFDFAMALSGGDPDKMEKMKDAFLKGFKQATDAWGDELPEISQKTYGAVLQKFDDYANQNKTEE